ncbi:hypothetical protein BDV18DRAFT_167216 [Aspergillus unguis]
MAVENLQPVAYAVISIAFALGTTTILLRLYCRWRLRVFGKDDAASILLFCVNNVQQAILYVFLQAGCGLPPDKAPKGALESINKFLFIEEVFFMFVHFVLKMTFLLFYLRLTPQRSFQWTVYGTMLMCLVFLIIEWLLAFLQARPLDAFFHPDKYPDAKFLNQYIVEMVPSALNAFSDIVILIIPIPSVLKLQMNARRKIAVLAIICFGSLSVVTALCRFIVLKQLITDDNTTYVMGNMVIVAGIEIQIAVVAVNLPALRSLFTTLIGSSHDQSSYNQYNQYNQRAGHKMSTLKSKKPVPRSNLGATLTGSEEELMQQGSLSHRIHVETNVDVASCPAEDEPPTGTTFVRAGKY